MPEPVIAHVTLSTGEVVELRVQGWPEKPGAKLANMLRRWLWENAYGPIGVN